MATLTGAAHVRKIGRNALSRVHPMMLQVLLALPRFVIPTKNVGMVWMWYAVALHLESSLPENAARRPYTAAIKRLCGSDLNVLGTNRPNPWGFKCSSTANRRFPSTGRPRPWIEALRP